MCCFVRVLPSDDPLSHRRVFDDTVVLHNAGPEDTAVYQCEATNSHGSLLANVNIMVLSKEKCFRVLPRVLPEQQRVFQA